MIIRVTSLGHTIFTFMGLIVCAAVTMIMMTMVDIKKITSMQKYQCILYVHGRAYVDGLIVGYDLGEVSWARMGPLK